MVLGSCYSNTLLLVVLGLDGAADRDGYGFGLELSSEKISRFLISDLPDLDNCVLRNNDSES